MLSRPLRTFATSAPPPDPDPDPEPTKPQSFRSIVRRYGVIGAVTYVGVSASVFWSLYFAILYLGFDAVYLESRLRPVFEKLGLPLPEANPDKAVVPEWLTKIVDPATFTATFVLTKFLLPLEIGATLALTPLVARWYRARLAAKAVVGK
ncbi:hypothetical protein DFJ74DRAFT_711191 [Hyaloraphidium curvatum]|nr:hypothetical protein DFJ74DRAFT_711191 [Hyaloraphidium curvatum]